MASVYQVDGRWCCAVKKPDGRRTVFRLGNVTKQQAKEIAFHISVLEDTAGVTQPSRVTAMWIDELPKGLRDKLERANLVKTFESERLQSLIDYARARKAGNAAGTRVGYEYVFDNLMAFFRNTGITTVTEADAIDFKKWVAAHGGRKGGTLAPTTVTKRCDRAREIFEMAVQKRWIDRNPFSVVRGGPRSNSDREFYVSVESIESILAALSSPQRRLQVCLSRYAGLACPSEILSLRWDRIFWDKHRMRIYKQKIKRYRECPLFPAIQPLLLEAFEAAPEGEQYVIYDESLRKHTNHGTWLRKAAIRAKVEPWPRIWHNMRSSAIKDAVARKEAPEDVSNWFGASIQVIMKHYHSRSTDASFARAAGELVSQ